jgi:hypothetical protein
MEKIQEKIENENKLRVENEEREEMLNQLKKINDEIEKNEQKLRVYEKNDPIRIKNLEKDTKNLLRLEEMVNLVNEIVER